MENNNETSYNQIRIGFESSPFVQLLGFELTEITKEEVTLKLPIQEKLLNTYGNLHGGAYATLIDNIISLKLKAVYGHPVVTVDLNVKYIASVNSGTIVAKAKVYGKGRNIKMGEAEVFDQAGNFLAKGSGTFKLMPLKAEEDKSTTFQETAR